MIIEDYFQLRFDFDIDTFLVSFTAFAGIVLIDIHLINKANKIELLSPNKVIFKQLSRTDLTDSSVIGVLIVISVVGDDVPIGENLVLVEEDEVGIGMLGDVDGDDLVELVGWVTCVYVVDVEFVDFVGVDIDC